jgi:hypothetical protein
MFVSGSGEPATSCVGTPLSPVTAAVTVACAAAGAHANIAALASAATSFLPFILPPEVRLEARHADARGVRFKTQRAR